MSQNEKRFSDFLDSKKIEFRIPTKDRDFIDDIPFNKNGKYKPDFYLPEKDLYIELKSSLKNTF